MSKKAKRPRDPNQIAKLVCDIATGQARDTESIKDAAASAMGKKGGTARAKRLTPEQRSDIARLAADARWKKD